MDHSKWLVTAELLADISKQVRDEGVEQGTIKNSFCNSEAFSVRCAVKSKYLNVYLIMHFNCSPLLCLLTKPSNVNKMICSYFY